MSLGVTLEELQSIHEMSHFGPIMDDATRLMPLIGAQLREIAKYKCIASFSSLDLQHLLHPTKSMEHIQMLLLMEYLCLLIADDVPALGTEIVETAVDSAVLLIRWESSVRYQTVARRRDKRDIRPAWLLKR